MAIGKSRRDQVVRVVALVVLVLIAFCIKAYQPSQGAGAAVPIGMATIVDPNTNQPLTTGGSTTVFTVALPAEAACTGDSANAGYRVQSFMVPTSVDPATLTFGSSGPLPTAFGTNFREPLYAVSSQKPYVNAQTAAAVSPGGPGQIVNIPRFDFTVWSPGNVPPGDYFIGIACTLGPAGPTQLDKLWDVQVTFSANAADPAGITWTVSSPTTTTTTAASTTTTSSSTSTTSTTVPPTTTTGLPTTTTVLPTTTTVLPTTTTGLPTTTTVLPTTTTTLPPDTTTTVSPTTTTTVSPTTTTTVLPDTTTTAIPTTTTVIPTTTTVPPTTTTTAVPPTTTTTAVPPTTTTIGLPGPTTTVPVATTTPRNGLVCTVLQRLVATLGRFFPFLRLLLRILLSVIGCRP